MRRKRVHILSGKKKEARWPKVVSSSMFPVSGLLECRLCRLIHDPALDENVDNEDREERKDRCSEDEPLIGGMLRLEPNEEELDGSILRGGEDDERPEVIVPG